MSVDRDLSIDLNLNCFTLRGGCSLQRIGLLRGFDPLLFTTTSTAGYNCFTSLHSSMPLLSGSSWACGNNLAQQVAFCFITIECETGTANLVVFQKLFDKYRKEIIQSRLLMVEGKLQREGEVIHVMVKRCYNLTRLLQLNSNQQEELSLKPMSRSDETMSPFLKKKCRKVNWCREYFWGRKEF